MSNYHVHTKRNGVQRCGRAAINRLLPIAHKIKYLVVTGQSGIIPGSIAAFALNLDLVIIRKEGERSHGLPVEAPDSFTRRWARGNGAGDHQPLAAKCCILDDFVAYGYTLSNIERALNFRPRYIALYRGDGDGPLDARCRLGTLVTGPFTKIGRNLFRWEQP